jgi:hypothetical protein
MIGDSDGQRNHYTAGLTWLFFGLLRMTVDGAGWLVW